MSEADHQDTNGTASANGGDVPEIELIIKEEYICTNELPPDESHENYSDCEEFIKIENECLRELKEEKQESDSNYSKNSAWNTVVNSEEPVENNADYAQSLKRPESASSSSAIEYAIAVAEACEGFHYVDDSEKDLKSNKKQEKTRKKLAKPRFPIDEENMQKAIDDVLIKRLTISEAARKHNLAKSTLWLRIEKQPLDARKNQAQLPFLDSAICSRLSKGASLSETARALGISKATVYRHKQHLTEIGVLDSDILINNPVRQRFSQAHRAYRVNGMSARFAAKFFSLPHTSLWRYIKRSEAAKYSKTEEREDFVVKTEEISLTCDSKLKEVEATNVLQEVALNTETDTKNELTFHGNESESLENEENTPSESIKVENTYPELEDEMIFEDELLIRILK